MSARGETPLQVQLFRLRRLSVGGGVTGGKGVKWGMIASMPSWNIHTALCERVLADRRVGDLGIADANAFLFGNYVPDIYVGFMVPDASTHIDYCVTHQAMACLIPMPDADRFWDLYVARRAPKDAVGLSLTIGAWAHLVADRFYNGRFRIFWLEKGLPAGEVLRKGKQADFDLFGRSLGISACVQVTPELLDAAWAFVPYRIMPDDVSRAVAVANEIVRGNESPSDSCATYQLLNDKWLSTVLADCEQRIVTWLTAWQKLVAEGRRPLACDVRRVAGLPPATPDDADWDKR